jgi:8-oxo-dGTP diphosphatase
VPDNTDAVVHYTTLFLLFEGQWLLLRRSPHKRFLPDLYTGLGGRVEADELGDLRRSVLREMTEETGLTEADLEHLTLRRLLTHNRPGEPLTVLFYFTAELKHYALPSCTEGTLKWVKPEDFANLDIIETTANVLPKLVEDVAKPAHNNTVRLGVAHYGAAGLARVVWGE